MTWHRSGIFIVNFEQILHLFVVFLLLPLIKKMLPGLLDLFLHVITFLQNIVEFVIM